MSFFRVLRWRRLAALVLLALATACDAESCAAENLARDADAGTLFPPYCYQPCATDDECASDWEVCNRGRCRIDPDQTFCVDRSTSGNARGDREDCNAYVCDEGSGLCKRSCEVTTDCSPAFVCATDLHLCVPGQNGGSSRQAFAQVTPMHDAAGCVRACASADECEDNEICSGSECVLRTNFCDGTILTDGTEDFREDCAPYVCNPVLGQCLSDCRVSDECAVGSLCCGPPSNRCVGASTPEQCE